ncbi:hypothetical protein AB6A40_007010 [Gnathostoma spinigerum]|uniref:Uncharacterized protein n=1 Tax=Gnathostoma spinigerum TaxID=75299 RepID=A0ABD6EKL3_9BILA
MLPFSRNLTILTRLSIYSFYHNARRLYFPGSLWEARLQIFSSNSVRRFLSQTYEGVRHLEEKHMKISYTQIISQYT